MPKQFAGAVCAALILSVVPALADAPLPGILPGAAAVDVDQIGTELTVQNWVLCTTQANAESIAKARAGGVEPAFKAYSDLQTSKACGVFAVLKVILRQSLYDSAAASPHRTRVYRASVNLGAAGAEWPTGFVISGAFSE
jgi:fumarylacetoacetate (FAA) hydrolase family protein